MAPRRPTATDRPIPVERTSVGKISLKTTYAPAPHEALNMPKTRYAATNAGVVRATASAPQRIAAPVKAVMSVGRRPHASQRYAMTT